MSEETSNPGRKRRLIRRAIIGTVLLSVVVFLGWYLTSPQFHDSMRRRLISRLEQMTGGRVELGRFDWNLSKLEFDVQDLTIHGLEGPNEVPYAHADRVWIDARLISLFRRQIALDRVRIERPVFHLLVYPDGHTNQPKPKAESGASPDTQAIFDLAIKHAEARNGQLLLNENTIPFDLAANNLLATMKYVAADNRYDGDLKLTIEQARYSKYLESNADLDLAFSLRPNALELSGFHMVSGKSKLDASGKLVDFTSPIVNVTYRASLDGLQIARMLRITEIRRGQLDLNGDATYEKWLLTTKGKLVAHDLEYRLPTMHVRNIDAAAEYSVDQNRLTLTKLVGRALGGIAKGDAVVNWAVPGATKKLTAEQTGLVRLSIANMMASSIAEAFSTTDLQLTQLHAAGSANGSIKAQWRGDPSRMVLNLDMNVAPPAVIQPGETPVAANLRGTYEIQPERLTADVLDATLPYLRMSGNGTLGSKTGTLHLSVAVTDLSKVKPLLTIVNQQRSEAGDLAGQLNFEGTLSGKLLTPAIDGHLQVANLTFPLAAIWTPPPPLEVVGTSVPRQPRPKYIHIDSGVGDVKLSLDELSVQNGVIRRAGAQARIDFSTALSHGDFTDVSPLNMRLTIQGAQVAELQQIAGYDYPVSGKLASDLNVHGTRLNLQGGGRVQLTDALVYGQTIKSATADIQFVNEEAQVNNFVLLHEQAQISGSGAYNLKTERFRFQALGNNFDLATVPFFNHGHMSLAGRLNFNASGSGTVDAPLVNASAHLQNIIVNGQRVGDAKMLAVTKGDSLHLTAQSNFQSAEVNVDGTIRLRDVMPAHITAQFSNFDFMPFLQSVFQTKLGGQSYVGGTLTLEGPLRDPSSLTVVAQIPKLTAQMEGVELRNTEPIRFSMANQKVNLDSLHLTGTDTQFTATGSIDLTGNRPINMRADGRLNLKLAQSFDPDISSGGFVDFNVTVAGTTSKPSIVGEVKITNGAVSLIDFPNGLSNINGSLVFNEERIQIQSLTARTGGGDIRLGGFATYYPGIAFNITAQGEDVRMRYPQGVSTTGNLDLKLVGTLSGSTLSGDITITRFAFNTQFDVATFLAKANRPPEAPRASPLNNVRFNLHVVSTPQLQVQSSLAKLAGNADLRVRGTPSNPILLGRINLTEGQVDFNGATYRLDRGDVSFLNPAKTEPTIDVAATTRVRDYDITLRFSGQPSHGLKTNYSSDPPLPAADIINLLAFGQTREEAQIESTQTGAVMTESVSNAILGQAISNAVSSRMQKLFGVSRVKISPEVGSAQTNPTAQVTIEQQVSNKITVTYISNLTQSSQQAIFVEYNFDRNVSFVAGRDQYGVVSFDVRIRQRKR